MSTHQSVEQTRTTTLPNGLRVISESVPYVQSVSIGVWAGIGSRDESPDIKGISHFIEHMLFKGTEHRTARQIADEIESRGGHLNAFTDKEVTLFEARVLAEDTPLALDVLSDMLLHSQFDPEEIEREKRVVLEEIKMYEDSPEDAIHDVFLTTLWKTHPLGHPVIGSPATVTALGRERLFEYLQTSYRPDRMVVAAAGNLEHDELVKLAQEKFGNMEGIAPARRLRRPRVASNTKRLRRRTEQTQFCLGSNGYGKKDKERFSLAVLSNVLGGNMSSRLFQEIREKRGLAYNIGSYSRAYQDSGYFTIYGGTATEKLEQVLELTHKELRTVRAEGITEAELQNAKTQVRGALVLGLESMSARMNRYGESLLAYGRVIPIDEVLREYDAVSHESIAAAAERVLDPDTMTLAAIGPFPRARKE